MFSLFKKRNTVQTPESIHFVFLSRIGMIRPERMNRVFSPDISRFGIRVTHRSILEYNQHLKYVVDGIKGPGVISDHLFRNGPSFVLLRDWFVYENHYLDAEEHTRVFQTRVKDLVEVFIKLEHSEVESERRIVQQVGPILTSLREIVDQLIEVSKYDAPEFRDPHSL